MSNLSILADVENTTRLSLAKRSQNRTLNSFKFIGRFVGIKCTNMACKLSSIVFWHQIKFFTVL